MLQAALLDCPFLYLCPFSEDGLIEPEVGVSGCDVVQALVVSVAQVARRYAMNTNSIHKWLRDPKFAPDLKAVEDQTAPEPCFLSVEIVDRPVTEEPSPARAAICSVLAW
jgi:transposase